MGTKITLQKARQEFIQRGYIPLFDEYLNNEARLLAKSKEGYIIFQSLSNMRRNKKTIIFGKCNPYTIKNIKLYLKIIKSPYKLLSMEFVNSFNNLIWQCPIHGSFKKSWNSFLTGHGCQLCTLDRISGENAYQWKGGVSNLYEHLRQFIVQWKKDSIKQSNYKCVVTGKKFDTIHHLYGFDLIIQETIKITKLPIYKEINKYTKEELELLKNTCIKLHEKYGLGVCLSKEIHILFHHEYGFGNNTSEQFKEFTQRYYNHEFDNYNKIN